MATGQFHAWIEIGGGEPAPTGVWTPVYEDGHSVQTPTKWVIRTDGFPIYLFLSQEKPGVWLVSCLPVARFEIVGKMTLEAAKRVALTMIEERLQEAAASVGRLA